MFFDELGPPWPKHGCTDKTSQARTATIVFQFSKPLSKPEWQAEGWEPFVIAAITRWDSDLLVIVGLLQGKERSIYVHLPFNPSLKSTFSFDRRWHIAHARPIDDALVELSLYSFHDRARTFRGSLQSFGARSLPALV